MRSILLGAARTEAKLARALPGAFGVVAIFPLVGGGFGENILSKSPRSKCYNAHCLMAHCSRSRQCEPDPEPLLKYFVAVRGTRSTVAALKSTGWQVGSVAVASSAALKSTEAAEEDAMSGPDKGGKGLGKGGAKRHRKVLRDNIQGTTKPAIRCLARRGGMKRISGLIYEETRGMLKIFLENVISTCPP
ncbi:hypothetical protein GOP47_0028564 [Adiantum capillus-veneris]|nr:hypothetical protein GOP47_0028564 [Adiantum capillus-veneris]